MSEEEVETEEILSNYVAVTALDDTDQFGVLLPRKQGLLRTPAGNTVQSDNYQLLLHLVRELEDPLRLLHRAEEDPHAFSPRMGPDHRPHLRLGGRVVARALLEVEPGVRPHRRQVVRAADRVPAQAVAQLEADGIMVATTGKGPGVPGLRVPASVAAPVTAPVTTAFDRRASAEAEFAQAALAFASTHDLSVSVKTSGHSYAGSSAMKGSLLIWSPGY